MSDEPPPWGELIPWGELPPWPPQDPAIERSIREAIWDGRWGGYDGPDQQRVRDHLKQRTGRQHVRLMSSGSAALRWAIAAAGVGPDDAVAICAFDYPGILRAVELIGARPVLVDCEPDRPTMDPEKFAQVCKKQRITTVVASHLFGVAADLPALIAIARQHDVVVVEDACQSPGMTLQQTSAGGWGDLSTWSFGGSKPITAGSGGAILCDDPTFTSRLNRDLDRPSDASPLSGLQCAALVPQLETLNEQRDRRIETAECLRTQVQSFAPRRDSVPSYYKFPIRLRDNDQRASVLQRAERASLPMGEPFRAFGGRPSRRYETPHPIQFAIEHSERTVLLDHRALMVPPTDRQRMIDAVGWCLASTSDQ